MSLVFDTTALESDSVIAALYIPFILTLADIWIPLLIAAWTHEIDAPLKRSGMLAILLARVESVSEEEELASELIPDLEDPVAPPDTSFVCRLSNGNATNRPRLAPNAADMPSTWCWDIVFFENSI